VLVINNVGLPTAWLIPQHQNSKPLLMGPYTKVTHILFFNYSMVVSLVLRLNFLQMKQKHCIKQYVRRIALEN